MFESCADSRGHSATRSRRGGQFVSKTARGWVQVGGGFRGRDSANVVFKPGGNLFLDGDSTSCQEGPSLEFRPDLARSGTASVVRQIRASYWPRHARVAQGTRPQWEAPGGSQWLQRPEHPAIVRAPGGDTLVGYGPRRHSSNFTRRRRRFEWQGGRGASVYSRPGTGQARQGQLDAADPRRRFASRSRRMADVEGVAAFVLFGTALHCAAVLCCALLCSALLRFALGISAPQSQRRPGHAGWGFVPIFAVVAVAPGVCVGDNDHRRGACHDVSAGGSMLDGAKVKWMG